MHKKPMSLIVGWVCGKLGGFIIGRRSNGLGLRKKYMDEMLGDIGEGKQTWNPCTHYKDYSYLIQRLPHQVFLKGKQHIDFSCMHYTTC